MYATGALNLVVRVDTLTSFPVGDRSVTRGGVRGPKSTVPSSAILVGSLAAERSYRALGTPEFPILGGGLRDRGLMLVLCPFFL